ncbi:hypothetical protein [Massilia sp. Dwa41.01b]|uniref:hypothetical protein n=1 Tax=Massilia sp. Dwa41.01b TaxID=2709302 RepID=UPI001AEE4281|nr:hypothetical protein [Massilia sp. Dwa41.01b]
MFTSAVALPLLSTRQPVSAAPATFSHFATAAALTGSPVSVLAIRPALPLAPTAVLPALAWALVVALASASAAVRTDLALSMQLSFSAPFLASHLVLATSYSASATLLRALARPASELLYFAIAWDSVRARIALASAMQTSLSLPLLASHLAVAALYSVAAFWVTLR